VGRVLIDKRVGGIDSTGLDRQVEVLIVDDSSTMRRLIRAGIETDFRIRIVSEAATAREARDAIIALAPDVMILDVEMPGMNGLEFLRRVMHSRPMPVIMFSSATPQGSDAALRALSLGAIDCIEKPRFGHAESTFAHLTEMVVTAAKARVGRGARARPAAPSSGDDGWQWNGKWALIGASTGGVEAIETVLREMPADCAPTLITQHMPAPFLVSFAARLNAAMRPAVRIARDGDRPGPGQIFVAPGDHHLIIDHDGATLHLGTGPKRSGHRPSVDTMFASAVPHASRMTAVILTGMGRDGADGMKALRQAGADCIAQDSQSCVVYGMPRVAYEAGAVDTVLPLEAIAGALRQRTGTPALRQAAR
jgi:two-component system chemotaxis response regulator CheB